MVLASLHMSGRCAEMMLDLRYLLFDFDTYRICLVIMCNYLAAYTRVYSVACIYMRALLNAYLVRLEPLDLFSSEPPFTCSAFLYVRSDTTMDPMRVRETNALVRLCICTGSSEMSMFA